VTRHIQHIIDTAGNGEVAGIFIAYRTVTGEINLAAEFLWK
jgi:hypothetical protein